MPPLKDTAGSALRFVPFLVLLVAIFAFRHVLFVRPKSDEERLREALAQPDPPEARAFHAQSGSGLIIKVPLKPDGEAGIAQPEGKAAAGPILKQDAAGASENAPAPSAPQ